MRHHEQMSRIGYLGAAEVAATLLRHPAVATRWSEPSALPDFQISGLAGHLGRAVTQVERIVDDPPSERLPIPVVEHFTRNAWTRAGRDDAIHVAVRERGEETAAAGPAGLADAVDAALGRLRRRLPEEPVDRVIYLTGLWALRLDDFLLTRTLEIVVHVDDLAVSVGIPTPQLPVAATEPVIDLLAKVASWRHAPMAVVRTLSRHERAPNTIAAF